MAVPSQLAVQARAASAKAIVGACDVARHVAASPGPDQRGDRRRVVVIGEGVRCHAEEPGGPGTQRTVGGHYPAVGSRGTRDLAKPTGGTHNVGPPNVGAPDR